MATEDLRVTAREPRHERRIGEQRDDLAGVGVAVPSSRDGDSTTISALVSPRVQPFTRIVRVLRGRTTTISTRAMLLFDRYRSILVVQATDLGASRSPSANTRDVQAHGRAAHSMRAWAGVPWQVACREHAR